MIAVNRSGCDETRAAEPQPGFQGEGHAGGDQGQETAIVNWFSRKIVGWSMKPSLSRELAMDAPLMAVWRRKPVRRVVVPSDQESPYGGDDFKRFRQAKIPNPA